MRKKITVITIVLFGLSTAIIAFDADYYEGQAKQEQDQGERDLKEANDLRDRASRLLAQATDAQRDAEQHFKRAKELREKADKEREKDRRGY